MPVKLSRPIRGILKTLLDLTMLDAIGNEQTQRLATQHRKPVREMLRQNSRNWSQE